jgi:TATA-binding protein-associated factor Taf7
MADIEIGLLTDRLGDDELAELAGKLERLGAPALTKEDDAAASTLTAVDGSVLDEFLDRLEAHDLACEIYLPLDFEGRVEVGEYRVGSASALVEILEEMKDELGEDDEEEDDDDDDDDEDADEDEEDDDDEEYANLRIKDAKIRRLWKVVYDGAQAALDRRQPLFVIGD